MDKEALEKKPYYPIFLDLIKHPHFAVDRELALFTADFIYQSGYRKTKDEPPLLSDTGFEEELNKHDYPKVWWKIARDAQREIDIKWYEE